MSAQHREATEEDSTPNRRRPASRGARQGIGPLTAILAGIGFAGALLAIVATWSPVVRFATDQDVPLPVGSQSGYDRHSVALVLLGAFGLLMIVGAVRRARPAMAALALAGLAVLLITVAVDLPDLGEAGQVDSAFDEAKAVAGSGYYMETAAGVCMLASGVLLLLLGGPARRQAARRRDPAG